MCKCRKLDQGHESGNRVWGVQKHGVGWLEGWSLLQEENRQETGIPHPERGQGLMPMIGNCSCLRSQWSHGPAYWGICVESSWWQREFWEQSFQAQGCVPGTSGTEIAVLRMCTWGLAPCTLKRALSFIKEDSSKAQIRRQLTISNVAGDPSMQNTLDYSILSRVTFPSEKSGDFWHSLGMWA